MVELDTMPCADGTPVVFHDDRLDDGGDSRGITDESGVVWETPLEGVRTARVLDSDETVPTLGAVLDALPPSVGVNVELKNPGTTDVRAEEVLSPDEIEDRREQWDPFVENVLAVLDGRDNEFLVSSFAEAAIASASEATPSIPTAPLLGHSAEVGLTIAERYECDALHPSLSMIPGPHVDERRAGDADLLVAAADLGCDVNVWTVRTWHQADRLRAAGVDGLIADYPRLLEWDE